jgi:outer membrane murein-binding lipoprotein Lpp
VASKDKGRGAASTDVPAARAARRAVFQVLSGLKEMRIPMPRRGKSEGDCKTSGWKFPKGATMTFTAMLLLAGCVSQKKYDTLDAQYQQLNQTMSAEVAANQMQITRLQNAIKVTVNHRESVCNRTLCSPAA